MDSGQWLVAVRKPHPPKVKISKIGDRVKATAALPDVAAPAREAKTGTADLPEKGAQEGAHSQGANWPESAENGHFRVDEAEDGRKTEVATERPETAAVDDFGALAGGGPGGTRTPDRAIMSRLL